MKKISSLIDMVKANERKVNELMCKKEEKKKCNVLLWVLAIVGAMVAIGGIAYMVYCYFKPDYLEDFEDKFEDDFEDDFEDEDEVFEDDTPGV
mgnify:CR=1 FL=1